MILYLFYLFYVRFFIITNSDSHKNTPNYILAQNSNFFNINRNFNKKTNMTSFWVKKLRLIKNLIRKGADFAKENS